MSIGNALGRVRLEVNECVPGSATVVVLDAARRATLALSQKRSGEVATFTQTAATVGRTANNGGSPMATFIVLASFTDQGIHEVKDTIGRAEAFKEMAKKIGVSVKDARQS